MDCHDDYLTFLDLLDLDEEVVDARLKTIMQRTSYSEKHLMSAIQLLKYKILINNREGSECENDQEYTFAAKLFQIVNEDNVGYVSQIISLTIALNPSTIVSKSEHLVQQILSDLDLPERIQKGPSADHGRGDSVDKTLCHLRICDSILEAVSKVGESLNLQFLESPLENILNSNNEKLKLHFLTNTVPKFLETVVGHSILDRIWMYVKNLNTDHQENALKIMCSLSEYFLPVTESNKFKLLQSEIPFQQEFWQICHFGLMSNNASVRKKSIYLIKRAIDYLIGLKKITEVKSLCALNCIKEDILKQMWDEFFVLMDSLEEKQSNIVVPSLKLFDRLNHSNIGNWIQCAFNLGLQHDNTQVRLKCVEYKLKTVIASVSEAVVLLEAINDASIFDKQSDCNIIMSQFEESFNIDKNFANIFKATTKVKWSAVPFYHISCVLSKAKEGPVNKVSNHEFTSTIVNIFEILCNVIPIRRAVKVNMCYLIGEYKNLSWTDLLSIYSRIKWSSYSAESQSKNPLIMKIKNIDIGDDKQEMFNTICKSHANIDFAIVYLESHIEDMEYFLNIIKHKIQTVNNIFSRQYAEKSECFGDLIFISHLFDKCFDEDEGKSIKMIRAVLKLETKTILQHLLCLLACEKQLNLEEIGLLFKGFDVMTLNIKNSEKEILLQLYKSSLLLLIDSNSKLDKKVIAICIINTLKDNELMHSCYEHELVHAKQFIELVREVSFKDCLDANDSGRFRNAFLEACCETSYFLMKDVVDAKKHVGEIHNYLEYMIECGGYGCLKWILKIVHKVLPFLVEEIQSFNVEHFLKRMWTEIEELKSNNQYTPCIEEFINILLQDCILSRTEYREIVMQYSRIMIEYATVKNTPLYCLVMKMKTMNLKKHETLQNVLGEILMCKPVPKKDHRIIENLAIDIFEDSKYGLINTEFHYFFKIQYLSVTFMVRFYSHLASETINNQIDFLFSSKQRYHGNSHFHRVLLTGLQHRLILYLHCQDATHQSMSLRNWMIQLLGKMPHQPSVRVCMEWYISLSTYFEEIPLDEDFVKNMDENGVPLSSQFVILYWVLKQKLWYNTGKRIVEDFENVMNILLSHTMGQMFNVRLNAQYLALKIYELEEELKTTKLTNSIKRYDQIIDVIRKTFIESSKDKNFVKLKDDYFINKFDIVKNLSPIFVYYYLPKYHDIGNNEKVDETFVRNVFKAMEYGLIHNTIITNVTIEWVKWFFNDNDEAFSDKLTKAADTNIGQLGSEITNTIQKKYIPWKNMTDIDVYESAKKKPAISKLIVVASLIDKLPNLGGMARTSEVFGVDTYVVDSVRHLQDKQFQGLSVSAERWVNIEEVRPGSPLKEYLMKKKNEGYSIVAAEQTSTSCQLQDFTFPRKTVLLLGHEKEGVPCDLLPLMDTCVEIPQQGFVRSLNVHVTAAIFIWEYSRQNILASGSLSRENQ